MMDLLLNLNQSLRSMLDLCPNFKNIAFKEWMQGMSNELKQDVATFNATQPKEESRTRHDIKIKINVLM